MDAADREPGGHDHRIDTLLLPLKKRASNYSSGLGRTANNNPYASSYKKKRVDDASALAEMKDTAGALEALVPCQRRPVPSSASREPTAELPRQQQLRRSPQRKATFGIVAPSLGCLLKIGGSESPVRIHMQASSTTSRV
jgi:hypothetical protein